MGCKIGVAEGDFVTWKVAVGHLRMKSKLREAELKSGEGQNPDKNTRVLTPVRPALGFFRSWSH